MLERSDVLALHEPLEGLVYIGPLDAAGRTFDSAAGLLDWLVDEAEADVFLKETMAPRVMELVRAHARFLTEARHAFLIRRPQEIAASFLALEGDLRIHETGVEALHEMHGAVRDAGGQAVVIDSDDLVRRPEATMEAYCAAVGLAFDPDSLSWEAGIQPAWERTARWHEDASASTGFHAPGEADRHGLASHPDVIRFAERHSIFYDRLWELRLHIDQAH